MMVVDHVVMKKKLQTIHLSKCVHVYIESDSRYQLIINVSKMKALRPLMPLIRYHILPFDQLRKSSKISRDLNG